MPDRAGADIVLVNPRFEASYWGLEGALPLLGKRAAMPVASLPLLAALTPPQHRVTIVDENVSRSTSTASPGPTSSGSPGMSVQRARMHEILVGAGAAAHVDRGRGPWVSVPRTSSAMAWSIFVGEAEETWPRFLDDWRHGTIQRRYEQPARPT